MAKTITIPTNAAELKTIKAAIDEGVLCLQSIDTEKEALKDIVDDLNEKYSLPKKFLNRMIKQKHKSSFDDDSQEQEDYMELFAAINNAK